MDKKDLTNLVNDLVKAVIKKPCNEPCPKCGGADINRNFRREGELFEPTTFGNRDKIGSITKENVVYICPSDRTSGCVKTKQECIQNHCRTCHFDWYSAVTKEKQ